MEKYGLPSLHDGSKGMGFGPGRRMVRPGRAHGGDRPAAPVGAASVYTSMHETAPPGPGWPGAGSAGNERLRSAGRRACTRVCILPVVQPGEGFQRLLGGRHRGPGVAARRGAVVRCPRWGVAQRSSNWLAGRRARQPGDRGPVRLHEAPRLPGKRWHVVRGERLRALVLIQGWRGGCHGRGSAVAGHRLDHLGALGAPPMHAPRQRSWVCPASSSWRSPDTRRLEVMAFLRPA